MAETDPGPNRPLQGDEDVEGSALPGAEPIFADETANEAAVAEAAVESTSQGVEAAGIAPEDLDESDEEDPDLHESQQGFFSRIGSSFASTGRFIWDIPGNLTRATRPALPQIRGAMPNPPLGARQVSHGYADDLWQARPTLDRPYPVVLVHGTISSKNVWQNLVLRLRDDGFVVFAPDYGVHGTQDIPASAEDLGAYIEQVLSATGAEQVDIVGHSQGGLLARYWINEMGGEDYVHHLISLGSPHKGTTLLGMLGGMLTTEMTQRMAAATIRRVFGAAGMQQIMGSPLLDTLGAGPDTRPLIRYTCYATRNDATVVPHENSFLSETEGAAVTNQYLQDLGVARVRHEDLPTHPQVQEIVHQALLEALDEEQQDDWENWHDWAGVGIA
ncbi:esterase/lipase family protein [Corynebacterium heidelbergense]|uniref:esterase/lipase family protein n=1 Tax=Corynebacterium heidelbergense TaxID=2055947 RepID=UPI001EE7079F|nr:triacylglycerol lipase [Corynebacterium heidelbergense]WCZ35936.1 Lipase precursor [Corynebacterium heidelbergense]